MISETDKIKQKKLFDIFRNCDPKVIGKGFPDHSRGLPHIAHDCVSPWEPDVIFLHDSQQSKFKNLWDEHIVIRHPFHYSFAIAIKRDFADKVLILGGLP